MGLYDREYYRDDAPSSFSSLIGGSMVTTLVVINVAIFLVNMLIGGNPAVRYLALHSGLMQEPWRVYQFITYGFVHSPENVLHILFNMIGLWIFGRDLEGIYGTKEFLRIYLTAVLIGGLVFWAGNDLLGGDREFILLGASGAVMAVMMLSVMHFPTRTILLNFFIPVPAWLLMAIYIVADLMGAFTARGDVAHTAHLAGVGFGFAYYYFGWSLGRFGIPERLRRLIKRRPNLRIHSPGTDKADLDAEVDRILSKISSQGEGSLTARERATLEEASRRYQRRQSH